MCPYSNLQRQVKSLFCRWEVGPPGDSFLFSLSKHWGTELEVQGHRVWSGNNSRSNSLGSCLYNYIINRAWSLLSRSFVISASAHTACQVSGSLVFPPCDFLYLWLCSLRLGSLILLCPWVFVTSWLLTTHLGISHCLFGLYPALSYIWGSSVLALSCSQKTLPAKHSPISS